MKCLTEPARLMDCLATYIAQVEDCRIFVAMESFQN